MKIVVKIAKFARGVENEKKSITTRTRGKLIHMMVITQFITMCTCIPIMLLFMLLVIYYTFIKEI